MERDMQTSREAALRRCRPLFRRGGKGLASHASSNGRCGGGGNMSLIAKILIALIALEHLYFLVLEMFLWTTPRTRAAFGMTAEQGRAEQGARGQSGTL